MKGIGSVIQETLRNWSKPGKSRAAQKSGGRLAPAWLATLLAIAMISGCAKPAKPDVPLKILRFETKPTDDPYSKTTHFAWKLDIQNNSDELKKINGILIRFLDKDGFKITDVSWMGYSEVPAHSTVSISDRASMETKQWATIGSYKVEFR